MPLFSRFLLFAIVLVISWSCSPEKEFTFSIQGSIDPVNTEYLLLKKEEDIERKIATVIDTLYPGADGKFKATYDLEPHLYTLTINDSVDVKLAINKGDKISLDITKLDHKKFKVNLNGSKDAEALLAYETFREASLDTLVKSVRRQIKALKKAEEIDQKKIDSLGVLEISNYELHLEELNDYIKNNMDGSLGLYATSIRWKGPENFDLYNSLVDAYEAAYPELEISKKIREKLTRLQQSTVGGTVADIAMANIQGETIRLFSSDKKYILIDFWASWCGPCRRESASLNKIYTKYKDSDLEIFGVSLDDDREKWLKALKKDNRTWPNVSSLERFKTKASFDYAVTALPDNFLIDSDRKIIARNIHGEALETMLDKLIK